MAPTFGPGHSLNDWRAVAAAAALANDPSKLLLLPLNAPIVSIGKPSRAGGRHLLFSLLLLLPPFLLPPLQESIQNQSAGAPQLVREGLSLSLATSKLNCPRVSLMVSARPL